ncbi:ABC transporter ATP-binding protein [Pelistega europaea]|uniref:ATP-binding cassette domain-containing protein n=1 Tax=Pelistega europaea TaxID=106147 RepID=A0A7Y4L7U3_9BURK|nr:oligopeptide/dipeptide ABC transporter ATP-binding protein [Pelistega europaea]NOL48549.1 ATP-binding cassette domain-containing protein [Pelistega europaea]
MPKPLVSVEHVSKNFTVGHGKTVKAVCHFNLQIYPGETVGLVGESGCGKSTIGRVILGLYQADEGQVLIDGQNVHHLTGDAKKAMIRQAQMIFQDPYASLNPRATVMEIIAEPLEIHQLYRDKNELKNKIHALLEEVGLRKEHADRYPHEFSGGQRQRIGIARALALNPRFIVADEPISALDVSIQAQIVLLLQRLQREKGLTYLFIAHDLSMVKYISDRVGVMYLGHLVELAESKELYEQPLHPYTQALLSAIPIPDPALEDSRQRIVLQGELPSAMNPPSGCVFHTRCPKMMTKCQQEEPLFKSYAPQHFVACHWVEEQFSGRQREARNRIEGIDNHRTEQQEDTSFSGENP